MAFAQYTHSLLLTTVCHQFRTHAHTLRSRALILYLFLFNHTRALFARRLIARRMGFVQSIFIQPVYFNLSISLL